MITSREFVPLSNSVLSYLANDDNELKKYFQGVFAADELPRPLPTGSRARRAYIVNTDPSSEPGQHWLAMCTQGNQCKTFDSYGLPLALYTNPDLQDWWSKHKFVSRRDVSLQALDSQICVHFSLLYLIARARGITMGDFLARWKSSNLVRGRNDKDWTRLCRCEH